LEIGWACADVESDVCNGNCPSFVAEGCENFGSDLSEAVVVAVLVSFHVSDEEENLHGSAQSRGI
jgi:hypothetical protein